MALLSEESEAEVRQLFISVLDMPGRLVARKLHVTIYHARRPLFGLPNADEPLSIDVPGAELRMMALAPGGENARPDIDPSRCSVGIRIRRAEGAAIELETLRTRFLVYETARVLGTRPPSTTKTSAFGARSYQPHLTVLRPGAVRDPDLSKIGVVVRKRLDRLHFDRLVVRSRTSVG